MKPTVLLHKTYYKQMKSV